MGGLHAGFHILSGLVFLVDVSRAPLYLTENMEISNKRASRCAPEVFLRVKTDQLSSQCVRLQCAETSTASSLT